MRCTGIADALLPVAAAIALMGCDGRAATAAPPEVGSRSSAERASASAAAQTRALTDWTAGGCPIPSDSPQAPIGRSPDALVQSYGRPKSDVRFILGEAIDPVAIALRNVLSSPADLRREVREQAWERAGCELRVWSVVRGGRWTAFASDRAPAGGEH